MADMGESGGGHEKGGKKRAKKGSTRVDMTPLVDLAFLLLTFFVLTSTFSESKMMKLAYPAKPKEGDKGEPINNAITFLLSKDKIYWYYGEFYSANNPSEEGKPFTKLTETNFGPTGVRELLGEYNKTVLDGKAVLVEKLKKHQIDQNQYDKAIGKLKGQKSALAVLVKTDSEALCKNFIDLIDELKIHEIGAIAPIDLDKTESELLKLKLKGK
jgi:biopolymer transport protein ExbD